MTELYNLKADDSVILGLTYQHDAMGNPIGMLESTGDSVTWTYDAADRLTREQRSGASAYDMTYTYDPLGNRLVKQASGALTTYAYDLANQLTTSQDASGVTTYTYDLAGNVQVVEQPTGQRTTTTWDDQNRQTSVLLPAGGIVTSAYRFDGLRHEKAEPQSVTKYIWDLQNYLAETDQQDDIQAIDTNEPQPYGNLISQYHKGPTIWVPSFYQYDALGSARVLTDWSGDATDTYVYDAWGNEVAVSGTTINPLRWVGQVGYYWDADTETFYIRARVYEPTTARWMSQDPLFYPFANAAILVSEFGTTRFVNWRGISRFDGNRYGYLALRPLDPSGLDQVKPSDPPVGVVAPAGKTCAITMRYEEPNTGAILNWPAAGASGRVDAVLNGANSREQILKFIRDNQCCSIFMIGHRGGFGNEGGIITVGKDGKTLVLLPSNQEPRFEDELAKAFADNECTHCTLNIVTCGRGPTQSRLPGVKIRRRIAELTGCLVCGTSQGQQSPFDPILDPCTRCDGQWPYTCELPPKGWKRSGTCLRWDVITVPPLGSRVVCAEYLPVPVITRSSH